MYQREWSCVREFPQSGLFHVCFFKCIVTHGLIGRSLLRQLDSAGPLFSGFCFGLVFILFYESRTLLKRLFLKTAKSKLFCVLN